MAQRKNIRRFLLVVVVVTLVALYAVAHLAMRTLSTGPLRTRIEKNLTQALGLEVTLDELVVALLPMPHLHAEGVFFAKGVGKIAEVEATRVSALLIYHSNTKVAKLLTKYPKH